MTNRSWWKRRRSLVAEQDHPVPPDLLARLMKMRDVLGNNGSVGLRRESDRRESYRLRARVPDERRGRRQISIPLDDGGTARAVAALLREWRSKEAPGEAHCDQRPSSQVPSRRALRALRR